MEVALNHPRHDYYRRPTESSGRDPFDRAGDFFTAQHIEPAFGRSIVYSRT
jgi:SAM-dependent MidA family methyltransferase